MKKALSKILLLVFVLGGVIILLGLYFPWFVFSGSAEHALGTVNVSGRVYAFGMGRLDSGDATVTVWSSTSGWSSASSDFWFGDLTVVGLILLLMSAILFLAKRFRWTSVTLTLIGCTMTAAASTMAVLYKPELFVIIGFVYGAPPGIDSALLYRTQATVGIGLGPWISLAGAIIAAVSAVSYALCARWNKRV
jgi:hypothetical protein